MPEGYKRESTLKEVSNASEAVRVASVPSADFLLAFSISSAHPGDNSFSIVVTGVSSGSCCRQRAIRAASL